jgi:hypothetical protein
VDEWEGTQGKEQSAVRSITIVLDLFRGQNGVGGEMNDGIGGGLEELGQIRSQSGRNAAFASGNFLVFPAKSWQMQPQADRG